MRILPLTQYEPLTSLPHWTYSSQRVSALFSPRTFKFVKEIVQMPTFWERKASGALVPHSTRGTSSSLPHQFCIYQTLLDKIFLAFHERRLVSEKFHKNCLISSKIFCKILQEFFQTFSKIFQNISVKYFQNCVLTFFNFFF